MSDSGFMFSVINLDIETTIHFFLKVKGSTLLRKGTEKR